MLSIIWFWKKKCTSNLICFIKNETNIYIWIVIDLPGILSFKRRSSEILIYVVELLKCIKWILPLTLYIRRVKVQLSRESYCFITQNLKIHTIMNNCFYLLLVHQVCVLPGGAGWNHFPLYDLLFCHKQEEDFTQIM